MQPPWQRRCPTLAPCHLQCCILVWPSETADVRISHSLLIGLCKRPQSCVWVFNGSWRSPRHIALTPLSVSCRQQHCSSCREGKGQGQCWCQYFCTLLIKLLALTACSRRAQREREEGRSYVVGLSFPAFGCKYPCFLRHLLHLEENTAEAIVQIYPKGTAPVSVSMSLILLQTVLLKVVLKASCPTTAVFSSE